MKLSDWMPLAVVLFVWWSSLLLTLGMYIGQKLTEKTPKVTVGTLSLGRNCWGSPDDGPKTEQR